MSRVVVVRLPRNQRQMDPPPAGLLEDMIRRGLGRLTDSESERDARRALFRDSPRIGIKINAIAGKSLTTRPRLTYGLASYVCGNAVRRPEILIWDRSCRELKDAGYTLNLNRRDFRIFGTDARGVGYESDLTAHLSIGSRLSRIQTAQIDASVSLAILKDHGLAGITAGMKNYFGAIHNPNKYHDGGCNPYVAEVFDAPGVREKHRLTVLDALRVQFHRGPSFHRRWCAPFGALIFSVDPVAADVVGWRLIERLRSEAGLPSLAEENREPRYLASAGKMGLGTAEWERIQVIEEDM